MEQHSSASTSMVRCRTQECTLIMLLIKRLHAISHQRYPTPQGMDKAGPCWRSPASDRADREKQWPAVLRPSPIKGKPQYHAQAAVLVHENHQGSV